MQRVYDRGGALLVECDDRDLLPMLYRFGGHSDGERIALVRGVPRSLGIYRRFEYGRDNRPYLIAYAVKVD